MMQKRDIILTAVFSTFAALITLASALFVCYWCHKRKRKREDEIEDPDSPITTMMSSSSKNDQGGGSGGGGETKKNRLNGFLNLKTPLISTKTLG